MHCLQISGILLYFKLPPKELFADLSKDTPLKLVQQIITKGDESSYQSTNIFEENVKQLTQLQDLELLYKSFKNIFEKSIEKNYERDFQKEAMTLLVKVSGVNAHFLDDLYLYDYDFNFVLISACHYIAHFARRPGGDGLSYLNLCLLQQYAESMGQLQICDRKRICYKSK